MGIPIIELCRLPTGFKYIKNNTLARLLLLISLQLNGQYQVLKTMICIIFASVCNRIKIVV